MKDNRFQAAAYTSLLIAMVLWASTFVALKLAFRAYDPMVVIFGRMLIASLCALFVPFVTVLISFYTLRYILCY